ncbi:MAG: transglutaminase family protein [Myxococcota bacterium]
MEREAFDAAVSAHDRALRDAGLEIWLGAEPTFTDPRSTDAPWLGAALGGDKLERALGLLRHRARPGAAVLRTLGRQYPDEPAPRWSLGVYARRDDRPCWEGPPDPALEASSPVATPSAQRFRDALADALGARSFDLAPMPLALGEEVLEHDPRPEERRLPWRCVQAAGGDALSLADPRLRRPPLEGRQVPPAGLHDAVAEVGHRLFCVGLEGGHVCLELPAVERVDAFLELLMSVAAAARGAGLPALVLRGFPPPADASVRFETITPDPAVIEINTAPATDLEAFLADQRAIHGAAEREGLSPRRLHFNGEVSDSGGGGHLTLGASTALGSPFFVHRALLPRLLVYLHRHPALSYFFSDQAGSSGQAPRADEGARELSRELALALARLERTLDTPGEDEGWATRLWESLAPFCADRFGNTHRAEVNLEKLWNPWMGGRGRLGVVELRALRQAPTAEHAVARAALFRAMLARLATAPYAERFGEWGDELQDRFALPFFLRRDLEDVFEDLERAGFGLAAPLVGELRDDGHRAFATLSLGSLELALRRAIEHPPLVGDLSQQAGTTRLIDASTGHLELTFHGRRGPLGHTRAAVILEGERAVEIPLVQVEDERDRHVLVAGIRYRRFKPQPGLHPDVPALDPLILEVVVGSTPEDTGGAWRLALHGWIPEGGVYPGLPETDREAAARRRGRLEVTAAPPGERRWEIAPRAARGRYVLDTRALL